MTPGTVRVYAMANVGNLRPGRWADVVAGDPRLPGWLASSLVALRGPHGETPPDVLPPDPCCGRL